MYRSDMGERRGRQTRGRWSRATKAWIGLVTFCLVVVAIGIFIFANPPSTENKQLPPTNSGTTSQITVPGTPASG
jgi:hypothetical protein